MVQLHPVQLMKIKLAPGVTMTDEEIDAAIVQATTNIEKHVRANAIEDAAIDRVFHSRGFKRYVQDKINEAVAAERERGREALHNLAQRLSRSLGVDCKDCDRYILVDDSLRNGEYGCSCGCEYVRLEVECPCGFSFEGGTFGRFDNTTEALEYLEEIYGS